MRTVPIGKRSPGREAYHLTSARPSESSPVDIWPTAYSTQLSYIIFSRLAVLVFARSRAALQELRRSTKPQQQKPLDDPLSHTNMSLEQSIADEQTHSAHLRNRDRLGKRPYSRRTSA